jgi:hypothetical protein
MFLRHYPWYRGESLSMTSRCKGKLSLCLTKYHAMKTYGRVDEGEWSVSRSGRFIPGEGAPGTHRIGSWAGLRADVDVVAKRKNLSPAGNRTPIVTNTPDSDTTPTCTIPLSSLSTVSLPLFLPFGKSIFYVITLSGIRPCDLLRFTAISSVGFPNVSFHLDLYTVICFGGMVHVLVTRCF